jgi:DNA polymerase-3 subunit gamma/tau
MFCRVARKEAIAESKNNKELKMQIANNNKMLYQKYRPDTWDKVVGQEITLKALRKASKSRSIPQSIILHGESGTGKTTISRLIAKSITCEDLDQDGNPCNKCKFCLDINEEVFHLACKEYHASHMDTESIKNMLAEISKGRSMYSNFRIFFIDEFQELVKKNATASKLILKELEKPNNNVFFIIGAMDITNFHKSIPSRTLLYNLKKIGRGDIYNELLNIVKAEKIPPTDELAEALLILSDTAEGSLRMAVTRLESCIRGEFWDEKTIYEELGLVSYDSSIDFIRRLFSGDVSILSEKRYYSREFLDSLRVNLLDLLKKQNGVAVNISAKLEKLVRERPNAKIIEYIGWINDILNAYTIDQVNVELVLFQMLEIRPVRS